MNTVAFLNKTILDVVGRGKIGHVYGVELELEGRGVMLDGVAAKGWKRTQDGSLRGESVEYVFSDPATIDASKERVNLLFKKFKDNGVDIKNSYRTSTHVHVNFGDKKVKQLLNFFVLFTMLEEILELYSGEDRVGNLFCLSSRRGEAVINVLADAVTKNHDFRMFAEDRYKYAACNLSTLYKFGTAEIRTMRGATSAKQVNDWLDIIDQIYHRSIKAKSPIEFIENISMLGPDGFLANVFSVDMRRELVKGLPAAFDFRRSLLDGARLCQLFAYDIGEDFDAVVAAPPPMEFNGVPGGRILPGPLNSRHVRIWNPRKGATWSCGTEHGGLVFGNGDALIDDNTVIFDSRVGRFKQGGRYLWFKSHPHFGDETRFRAREGNYCDIHYNPVDVVEHDDFDEDED